jgi:hypothetical protein
VTVVVLCEEKGKNKVLSIAVDVALIDTRYHESGGNGRQDV